MSSLPRQLHARVSESQQGLVVNLPEPHTKCYCQLQRLVLMNHQDGCFITEQEGGGAIAGSSFLVVIRKSFC